VGFLNSVSITNPFTYVPKHLGDCAADSVFISCEMLRFLLFYPFNLHSVIRVKNSKQ